MAEVQLMSYWVIKDLVARYWVWYSVSQRTPFHLVRMMKLGMVLLFCCGNTQKLCTDLMQDKK